MKLQSVPAISGGMLVEEVHTGRVLAMQGGFDVVGSSYNRAIQALRQPGSAFKPIVYVTALENGFTPATIELDAPSASGRAPALARNASSTSTVARPGRTRLRWGLEQSRNLMTVRAASTIGMPKITDTARKLGVGTMAIICRSRLARRHHGSPADQRLCDPRQPRSLGEADDDRLCRGPQRQGHLPDRQSLRAHGQLQRGRLGRQAMPRPPSRTRQLVDPMAAFQMVHVMEGVIIRGTATVLHDLNRPLFGKTGTTKARPSVVRR